MRAHAGRDRVRGRTANDMLSGRKERRNDTGAEAFRMLMNTFSELGKLKRDRATAHLVGMPWEHAEIFMQIARQEKCVISCRQLGRVCTGLMRAGYDTKGFRIKSKSCDFGPMAGFVCVDERLHKKGAAYNPRQKADVGHALHGDAWDKTHRWKATTEQVCLTEERFQELRNWCDDEVPDARIDPVQMNADVWGGTVARPVQIHYALRRETRHGDLVWALYYSDKALPRTAVTWRAFDVVAGSYELKPLLALVNPYPPYPVGHYKNCCTGDYDRFGVWPLKRRSVLGSRVGAASPAIFPPFGEDRRIAGMSTRTTLVGPPGHQKKAVDQQIEEFEDKRLGNINNRVHTVAEMVNSLVHWKLCGGRGPARDVIPHSDEAGRPFISGIDDHIIAFIPAPGANFIVGVESPGGVPVPAQWAAFFRIVDDLGFQIVLNTHWKAQMTAWGVGDLGTTGDMFGWRPGPDDPVRST
jgi:hypothetical protein